MNPNFFIELNVYLETIISNRQSFLNNFECIKFDSKTVTIFKKAQELTDKEINVNDFLKGIYASKFYEFILSKEILKYCLVWAHLGLQNKFPLIFRLALYTYGVFLYPYLFKKMLPFCDNFQLQYTIQQLQLRKNTIISKTNSHFEIIDYVIKTRNLENIREDQIYLIFTNITNTLRQIIRSIINNYINKKVNVDKLQYIEKEKILFQIYNSLAIIDTDLLQKISKDRKVFYNELFSLLNLIQKNINQFMKFIEEKLNNPLFLKINNLKSNYWTLYFSNILKENELFKRKNKKILEACAEYFRRYIVNLF